MTHFSDSNPWTYEQRSIISQILNNALKIETTPRQIKGCVTTEDLVHVYWEDSEDRYSFWFCKEWFKRSIKIARRGLEVKAHCAIAGLRSLGGNDSYLVVTKSSNRTVGVVGYNGKSWYFTRQEGNGNPVYCTSAPDAVLGLWAAEAKAIA